jgi:hypothetical protein
MKKMKNMPRDIDVRVNMTLINLNDFTIILNKKWNVQI